MIVAQQASPQMFTLVRHMSRMRSKTIRMPIASTGRPMAARMIAIATSDADGTPALHADPDNGHGFHADVACVDCHSTHTVRAPKDPIGQLSTCGTCHREQERAHRRSLHGRAAVNGDPAAPNCIVCHDHHHIKPADDPTSPTATQNVPLLCGRVP